MNQFYARPEQITTTKITLTDQEAKHATKVLRKSLGDIIYITDGAGTRYKGKIDQIGKSELSAAIVERMDFKMPLPGAELCMGLIRKRDRLEFAAEKATELGVTQISLFNADHTEPFRVRVDRIEAAVLSAMKQSLRVYLPEVNVYDSLDDLLDQDLSHSLILQADVDGKKGENIDYNNKGNIMMVVGPEGGLSERESEILAGKNAWPVSLGEYRLRAETAAMMMAGKFGNKKADPERPA